MRMLCRHSHSQTLNFPVQPTDKCFNSTVDFGLLAMSQNNESSTNNIPQKFNGCKLGSLVNCHETKPYVSFAIIKIKFRFFLRHRKLICARLLSSDSSDILSTLKMKGWCWHQILLWASDAMWMQTSWVHGTKRTLLTQAVCSCTGYVIMYASCPILWVSKLQTEIALHTTEAEYITLSQAMQDLSHSWH